MNLTIKSTTKTELIDITSKVNRAIQDKKMKTGLCFLFVPHTTAGITINENADPDVKSDMLMILNKIVPWKADYQHMEGNSPAHVKATLVGASETIAIDNGQLLLGTWQGIFFCEFDGPRTRKLHVHFLQQDHL
jgi:secondary thiamine-phosphate synthase enzyme